MRGSSVVAEEVSMKPTPKTVFVPVKPALWTRLQRYAARVGVSPDRVAVLALRAYWRAHRDTMAGGRP